MTRHLIVANQTLGGAELEHVIEERIGRGDARFLVLVPMTLPDLESSSWVPVDTMFGVPDPTSHEGEAIELARRRSQHRLGAMVSRIGELGGQASGEVGDPDPYHATMELLDRESFDEVIVSTLPAGISRWVKMDLPSRLARHVDCPVTVVEAEPTS